MANDLEEEGNQETHEENAEAAKPEENNEQEKTTHMLRQWERLQPTLENLLDKHRYG